MGIPVTSFAFHVTYTCPLTCAHCCFNSSPTVKDRLDPAFILEAIEQLPEDVELVAFTGGEPFLHGAHLVRYVAAAHARGFRTRIVTSAYFATSRAAADKRMAPLVAAGLDELSLSWDDYHEAFVSFDCIRNLVETAQAMGIRPAISSVQSAESRWTAPRIREALGAGGTDVEVVCESGLNLTGRAEAELHDATFKPNGYLGPCPFVLTGPTMSAKGKLLACCGVIPDTERLSIGDRPTPSEIPAMIERSLQNPLLVSLFLRGPYAIMKQISQRFGIDIPGADAIGGNCEACKILLTTPALERHLDALMGERAVGILSELLLLESLELLTSRRITSLWHAASLTRVDTAA